MLNESGTFPQQMGIPADRYHDMLYASPLATIVLSSEKVVMLWNPAAERLFGWTATEIVGLPCPMAPADEESTQRIKRAFDGAMFANTELHCTRRDGSVIALSASSAPVSFESDAGTGLMVVVADITERKRAEAAEREQRAFAEALRDISAALTSSLDSELVMEHILEMVGRVVPHDAANIMQLDGDMARVTHMRGYPSRLMNWLRATVLNVREFHNFRGMQETGKPYLVGDTHADLNWIPMEEWYWVRGFLSVPISVDGRVVGFINLDSKTPGQFTAADADRLQAFANHAAIAIKNARLYEATQRDANEVRTLHEATAVLFGNHLFMQTSLQDVARQISQTVVNEFGHLDCGVMLVDETHQQLLRLARAGKYRLDVTNPLYVAGAGLVPEAVRTASVIYAPDVTQDARYVASDTRTRSELVLPLQTATGVIGVLDLQSAFYDAFSEQDRRLLEMFAELAAGALENILLYDRVRRYADELEARVEERTAELNRVKDRAEAILNHTSDAILTIDSDGTIQQANRAFHIMFDYSPDGAFGLPLTTLIQPDDHAALHSAFTQVVATQRHSRIELMAQTARGSTFDADVILSPVSDANQTGLSVVCSVRDINERKRMEHELRKALARERELNSLKSRFITTVSHEFRTPLTMIMTSAEMLKNYRHRMGETDIKQRFEQIAGEVKNLTLLLDDLLDVSRARRPDQLDFNPTIVDAASLCETVVREVEAGIGAEHRFAYTMDGSAPSATMDAKLFRRLLHNLLSNAIKYSLPGTLISITLSCESTRKVLRVQDEGIGIADADRDNLFEAFYRGGNVGNAAGLGLGLAIVRDAVRAHGGTIEVDSTPGAGTTFTVILPESRMKEGVV